MKKKPFYSPAFVQRMIAGEKAHMALTSYLNYTNTNPKGTNMENITIKMSYQGFPVELKLERANLVDAANTIIETVDSMKARGFTAPVSYSKSGDDKLGKLGVVEGVTKGEKTNKGLQMYIVNGKLEDGREFSWNEFTPTTFRKDDKFKVVKNDRGFLIGEIQLPDMGKTDDIPF